MNGAVIEDCHGSYLARHMASYKRYRKRGFGAAEVEHKATKVTKSSGRIVGQLANGPTVGAGTQGAATYGLIAIYPYVRTGGVWAKAQGERSEPLWVIGGGPMTHKTLFPAN